MARFRFPLVLLLASSIPLFAGVLIPTDGQAEAISESKHNVSVVVNNQIAVTQITQTFLNHSAQDREAMYRFTLPEGAKIHSFAMWIKGQKMYGSVVEKRRGRQIYDAITSKKRDPALLEHVTGNTYQILIFPVLAHQEQKIELVYWQVLPYDSGIVRYLYPLKEHSNTTRQVDFSFAMEVSSTIPIATISSSSHKLSVEQGDGYTKVAFAEAETLLDRDFEVLYVLKKKNLGVDIICHRPDEQDGYFMASITPAKQTPKIVAKAVTFVVDISGSMAGEKIEQAKSALRYCIQSLHEADYFNLIAFENDVQSLHSQLLIASKANKEKACLFISELSASGGTNLHGALQKALAATIPPTAPHMVILLTDGEPTMGETDPQTILRETKQQSKEGLRIFTFGVGDDVNQLFLRDLAQENKGTSVFIRSGQNLELPVSLFFKKVANPVLSRVSLDFEDAATSQIFPSSITEVFQGTQIVVTGRYKNFGDFLVKLSGFRGEQRVDEIQRIQFPAFQKKNEFIARLWASHKIAYLLDNARKGGEKREIVDEIVNLSKTWGVLTPYTSYLVLESAEQYDHWNVPQPTPKEDGLSSLKGAVSDSGINVPALFRAAPPLDGYITAVSSTRPLVMLSLGRDDGVRKGHRFCVHRNNKYIGQVVVETVYKDACSARIVKNLTIHAIRKSDKIKSKDNYITTQTITDDQINPQTNIIKGEIIAVSKQRPLAMISVGKDHGVRKNDIFYVYRPDHYVGLTEIVEVYKDISAVQIKAGKGFRKGDKVIYIYIPIPLWGK